MCYVGELLPVPGWACGAPGRNRTCNPFGSPLLRRQRMPVSPLVLECASFRAVNQLAFRSRTELDFCHRAVHRLGVRLIPRSSRSILLRMFAVYKCAGHVADRDRRAEKGAQTTGAAVCRGGWYGKKGARISILISTIPILHLDLRKRCQLCDAWLYLPQFLCHIADEL